MEKYKIISKIKNKQNRHTKIFALPYIDSIFILFFKIILSDSDLIFISGKLFSFSACGNFLLINLAAFVVKQLNQNARFLIFFVWEKLIFFLFIISRLLNVVIKNE